MCVCLCTYTSANKLTKVGLSSQHEEKCLKQIDAVRLEGPYAESQPITSMFSSLDAGWLAEKGGSLSWLFSWNSFLHVFVCVQLFTFFKREQRSSTRTLPSSALIRPQTSPPEQNRIPSPPTHARLHKCTHTCRDTHAHTAVGGNKPVSVWRPSDAARWELC